MKSTFSSITAFTLALIFSNPIKATPDIELLIKKDLENLIATSELYLEFKASSCGEFLDKDFPKLVKKIKTSIEEIEPEVKPKYPHIWEAVTAEDGKIKRQTKKWMARRIEKVPTLSSNADFGCGVIFGELLSFGYGFERNRVSLMVTLKKASTQQPDMKP